MSTTGGETGTVFGDYVLVERVAVGGMAEVFLAKRRGVEGFEKTVAIKRILRDYSFNPDFVSMFINEAKIAARLSHPNVVQIFDFGKIEDFYFIAMEYVPGQNLRAVLDRGNELKIPLRQDLAALIVARACAGLEHAHRKRDEDGRPLGIIHRDVSPQNVLLSYEGDVKVVDFGIAKAVAMQPEQTRGVLKGKLAYLSPEQILGKPLDARSDVFAAGLVFYEVLTGGKLFHQQQPADVLDAILNLDAAAVAKSVPNVDRSLRDVLRRSLEPDVEKRFGSAGEMQRALEDYLRQRGDPGGTLQINNYMRLLFDREVGTETAVRLRSEIFGPQASRRRVPGGFSLPGSPRVRAAALGAVLGFAVLAFVGPDLRASRAPGSPEEPPVSPTAAPEPRAEIPAAVEEKLEKGRALLETKPAEARELFTQAAREAPDLFEPHFFLAKACTVTEDLDCAEREYLAAIELDPTVADAWYNLGYVHFARGRYEEAEKRYERAAALRPPYLEEVYYNLAACYERLDRKAKAIEALEKGLAEAPESELLRARLSYLRQ